MPDLVKDGLYFSYEKAQSLQTDKSQYEEIKHGDDQHDTL